MKNPKKYIEQYFSDELKLLIALSQNELLERSIPNLKNIDWDLFIQLCLTHRLVSHVLMHSKFLSENIPIPIYEQLIDYRLEHSKKSLNYAVHAIRVHQKFKEYDIQHTFFKGPLFSLELYNDIAYRTFGDIDILIQENDAEKAKELIEDLDFNCIYPKEKLTKKQIKANYTISHHYHFAHPKQKIDIELHWNITNPKLFFGKETSDILSSSVQLKVSNYHLPYINEIDNIVYQAAHGSIHQFYRLFWLKDFSVLLQKSTPEKIKEAWSLSKKLKLQRTFKISCILAKIIYHAKIPEYLNSLQEKTNLINVPIRSIQNTELKQKGILGKFEYVFYRLKLKPSLKYYFQVIFRLRTHLSDWELIRLPDRLFFLYYILRPFLLIYRNLFTK